MRIGNDLVGKFKGIPVYKSNMVDYVNNRHYYDEDNIFLIDGELIYKNEIFAKYDGNYVTEYDPHERAEYYTIPAIKVSNRGVEFTSSIGAEDAVASSNYETETEYTAPVSNFQPEDVDATLTGVYETDYFSSMTDIDAFLKANS